MPKTRADIQALEHQILSPHAAFADQSLGRARPEPECEFRTAFQRDRDRIVHSKAFRRLKHKTQVFLAPTGDHYRTRLTHTLEVAQIGRTISRALGLNEDLTEAIGLGHDLGHTPFGHAGETVLNEIHPGGFRHHEQSLRVVERLEKSGQGLNLTREVRDGILKHSKGREAVLGRDSASMPSTLEGQVVRVADVIAYIAHDVDDAIRAGIIKEAGLPGSASRVLGERTSQRIDTMVQGVIRHSGPVPGGFELRFDEAVGRAMEELRSFLYAQVYDMTNMHKDFTRSSKVIRELYQAFASDRGLYEKELGPWVEDEDGRLESIRDFIAGMTDRYALDLFTRAFLPRPWAVL